MRILTFVFSFVLTSQLNAELFSAIEELEHLSKNEEMLIVEMNALKTRLEGMTEQLKRDITKLEKEQQVMKQDSFNYILNPLNAFLLIKRLTFDISQTRKRIVGIADQFIHDTKSIRLPHTEFEGAIEGLVRLQYFYNLNPEDLAKGIIQDKKYRDDLTANELFAIGDELMNTKRNLTSLSYLKLALEKNEESPDMSQLAILERIYHNHIGTGNQKELVETIDKILELAPERKDLEEIRFDVELKMLLQDDSKKVKPVVEEKKNGIYSQQKEFKILSGACDGKLKKTDEEMSKLRCRLVSNSAYSKLCPFKVEEANLNPYIAIYHDVISEDEIKAFKSMSRGLLSRAQVLNKDASTKVDNVRVAKHSWHHDSTHKVYERLTRRVGDMSGLNMKTSEEWQSQNYGIGGHYDCHYDFTLKDAEPFNTGTGNRIATALFYLSDVEKGGGTAFPFLNILVKPKKGAAVFWFNMSTSGDLEFLTRHSGCPVLVGSKWVANKWMHEHGQEWARPCELKPAWTDEFYYVKFY